MSVFEPARIFQAEPKHPIESAMSDPNQRQQQREMFASEESETAQHQRADVSVDCVVGECANMSIGDVTDHRQIRQKEEQGEKKPATVVVLICEKGGDENGSTFEM
jgi:hypothetical protein